MADEVQIPSGAVSDGDDLIEPTRTLLRELNILPTDEELADAKGGKAVLFGPPQSVALIEAGITSATKYWAAGGAALVAIAWGSVKAWWAGEELSNQVAAIAGASIVTAALVIAIAYLLASDVRGRAAAAVATIQARERIALAMIDAAVEVRKAEAAPPPTELVALPKKIRAKYLTRPKGEKKGWTAIAIERKLN